MIRQPHPVPKNKGAPAFDVAYAIIASLVTDVAAAGGGDLDLGFLMTHYAPKRRMAKLIVGDRSEVLPEKYPFTPRADIARAIEAGRYDWYEKDIATVNVQTPTDLPAALEAVLVKLNHDSIEIMCDELYRLGFRLATLLELLAFGADYPDHYRYLRIFGLGTSRCVDGRQLHYYPVIEDRFGVGDNPYKRRLSFSLPFYKHDYQQTRYLAVPL